MHFYHTELLLIFYHYTYPTQGCKEPEVCSRGLRVQDRGQTRQGTNPSQGTSVHTGLVQETPEVQGEHTNIQAG